MLEQNKKFYERIKHSFNKPEIKLKKWKTPPNWVHIFYKVYPRFKKIPLKIKEKKGKNIQDCLKKRESIRKYSKKSVEYSLLSNLIYFSSGIKNKRLKEEEFYNPEKAKRFYPSGGARYPIEIYVIANNVKGLKEGVYHYNVLNNCFELILKRNVQRELKKILNYRDVAKNCFNIIMTGILARDEVKYGYNSLALALIEAGHIGQNLYLLAENYNINCCALVGFDNDKVASLIDIDQNEEVVLYVFSFGYKSQ